MHGLVVPLSECVVLVQSGDATVEVPVDRIVSVDGDAGLAGILGPDRPPVLREETFEEVRPNGDVVLHAARERRNGWPGVVGQIEWGVAPHEVPLLEEWKVFDAYGTELPLTVGEPGANGVRRAVVTLVRPVLPGETIRYADRLVYRNRITRDGELYRYVHRGDYPDDRLVTKMILLPAGARIVSATPEPLRRFDKEGAPCLVWRRFFAEGETYPIEVEYTLGE